MYWFEDISSGYWYYDYIILGNNNKIFVWIRLLEVKWRWDWFYGRMIE